MDTIKALRGGRAKSKEHRMGQVLLLELNELNFKQVCAYTERGKLPVFCELIARHGLVETTSERQYHELEPWIQWVTAHTGMPLAEHGVFRLGDIVRHDHRQIWEALEDQGLSVGAISPMNAKNRCRQPAFFMPDPWTPTEVTGPEMLRKVHKAVAQAVNDNANERLEPGSIATLVASLARYARMRNYGRYIALASAAARRRPGAKALFLDQLLADIFVGEVKRTQPDFASLFLNAGAHIQHHYMFSSEVYKGPNRNPGWYIPEGADPLLDVFEMYDRIVGQVRDAFPSARLMLATGLHQEPHDSVTYYWRLKRHENFLQCAGIPFQRVEPRMSRDFIIVCANADEATQAQRRLEAVTAADGIPLFDVDNRGSDLFVMFTWPDDIPAGMAYFVDGQKSGDLHEEAAFVAIKNGEHDGVGYFLDTAAKAGESEANIALGEMPERIAAACGARW
jgi:hypothetical protein